MSEYKTGDRVGIVAAHPENAGTEGSIGTVVSVEPGYGGLIAVKLDSRFAEAVKGYRAYTADQLRRV